jgi:hypothetical protein
MSPFKLSERTESYCLDPSRIGKILRKYQSLQKYNTIYLYGTCLALNRFFHLATAKVIPELQNKASEKTALQRMENLEW